MRKIFFMCALLSVLCTGRLMAKKVVGGDLSLVPAYESVNEKWKDADGNIINSYYTDGMITYVSQVAGWNSVRVRLLVNPDNDSKVATCQDIDYVKKLGKRIKDAGMNFLLDIFYSDTWTDVSAQWIPSDWGYGKNTATATLAAKVKSYTKESLNTLVAYGAKPDYVQIGNEVSYGMLWDSASGASTSNIFYTSSYYSYSGQSTNIQRFATLLKAAAEGVRTSDCPDTKIILHSERTSSSTDTYNFYSWVEQGGFTDYDIIGLSYYPQYHGGLSNLTACLSVLQSNWPGKQIHIVETAYPNSTSATYSSGCDTSGTWAYSFAGQAAFVSDLIATLQNYPNVTGLYYWQPEECGNGASNSGTNRVMDAWDNRGFWDITWKTTTHTLKDETALMSLQTFLEGDADITADASDTFTNLDFEECEVSGSTVTNCPGWTIAQEWSSGPWPVVVNEWHSTAVSGNALQAWNASGNALSDGHIIYQTLTDMPPGTYTITADVHTDYSGICLFANDESTLVTSTSTWGTTYNTAVTVKLSEQGSLTIGLKFNGTPSTTSAINLYADNFMVTFAGSSDLTLYNDADNSKTLSIYNGQTVTATLSGRNFIRTADYWQTLCLPFNLTASQLSTSPLNGAIIVEMSDATLNGNGSMTLSFEQVSAVVAGKPYLIKWESGDGSVENPVFEDVEVSNRTEMMVNEDANIMMLGITSPFYVDADDMTIRFLGNDNAIHYPSTSGEIYAFRAYFQLDDFLLDNVKSINIEGPLADGIRTVDNGSESAGLMDAWYDLCGRRIAVRPSASGIYIHNGKKHIIR